MNTESIGTFTAGLLAGAGLTFFSVSASYFISTIILDRRLSVESNQHIQDAQAIWDENSDFE